MEDRKKWTQSEETHRALRVERGRAPVEAERFDVLADVRERGDRAVVDVDRLEHRDPLIVDVRVRGPALAQRPRLQHLGVADPGRAHRPVGPLDRHRAPVHHVRRPVRVDAGRRLADPAEAEAVRRRLVVVGRDEHAVQPDPVRTQPGPDAVLVDVEEALLVEHFDGERSPAHLDHHRAGPDVVRDAVIEARRVRSATEEVAVPASIAVAVLVRVAGVVVTGVRARRRTAPRRRTGGVRCSCRCGRSHSRRRRGHDRAAAG